MSALSTVVRTELRLFLREPVTVAVAVVVPSLVLLGLAAVPALREPIEPTGNLSFVAFFAPSLLAISIAMLGFQVLPTGLATYRERGVLRRLSATPMRPASVLFVQLIINLVTATIGAVLVVAVAVGVLGVPAPRHPLGFAIAFLVGTAAVFSVGLLIAARAPQARTASGVGTMLFLLAMFVGGVYLPKFLLPDWLVRIGDFVPPGAGMFWETWVGTGAELAPLLVLAGLALAATAGAARFFRWE
ncbi:MAG: ABC transporter permease [Micromonosporaceae bacterium]|nr:ABC transporter permease [Micromonosporaceae bacterium]